MKAVRPIVPHPFDPSMYTAVIRENKRQIWIGSFVTAEEAARAYDVHARRVHGAFAALNFPETN